MTEASEPAGFHMLLKIPRKISSAKFKTQEMVVNKLFNPRIKQRSGLSTADTN